MLGNRRAVWYNGATMSDCSRTSYYRGCTYAWRFS